MDARPAYPPTPPEPDTTESTGLTQFRQFSQSYAEAQQDKVGFETEITDCRKQVIDAWIELSVDSPGSDKWINNVRGLAGKISGSRTLQDMFNDAINGIRDLAHMYNGKAYTSENPVAFQTLTKDVLAACLAVYQRREACRTNGILNDYPYVISNLSHDFPHQEGEQTQYLKDALSEINEYTPDDISRTAKYFASGELTRRFINATLDRFVINNFNRDTENEQNAIGAVFREKIKPDTLFSAFLEPPDDLLTRPKILESLFAAARHIPIRIDAPLAQDAEPSNKPEDDDSSEASELLTQINEQLSGVGEIADGLRETKVKLTEQLARVNADLDEASEKYRVLNASAQSLKLVVEDEAVVSDAYQILGEGFKSLRPEEQTDVLKVLSLDSDSFKDPKYFLILNKFINALPGIYDMDPDSLAPVIAQLNSLSQAVDHGTEISFLTDAFGDVRTQMLRLIGENYDHGKKNLDRMSDKINHPLNRDEILANARVLLQPQ